MIDVERARSSWAAPSLGIVYDTAPLSITLSVTPPAVHHTVPRGWVNTAKIKIHLKQNEDKGLLVREILVISKPLLKKMSVFGSIPIWHLLGGKRIPAGFL